MDPATTKGLIDVLQVNLNTIHAEDYYHLLLLTFLLLPIYASIRLGIYIFHFLQNRSKIKHTDIAI